MPSQPYPSRWPIGDRAPVREYPMKLAETFVKGDLLKLVAGVAEVAGADPATVIGFAQHDAALVPERLYPTKVLIDLADPTTEFNVAVTGTLTAANVGIAYGVIVTSGAFSIELAEVTATVMVITALDPRDSTRCFARFGLPAVATLQG